MSLTHPWRSRPAAPAPAHVGEEELRREVERLRAYVESRLQTQEHLLRAMLAESPVRTAEALEGRIQLAAGEAIAFAESGLERQEATLRALARRVAELTREAPAPETARVAPAATGAFWIGAGAPEAQDLRRLDIREDFYLADLANLPILPGGASRLTAAHVVEFVPAAALAESILPHWRSRLAPGGELVVVTLDGPAWAADLARGDFATLRRRLGADGAGRPPRNLLDAAGLAEALHAAGLQPGEPRHAPPFALTIAARAPAI
ncbi:MAG TPA: hypothetical protein VN715_20870 [Roseiarcus sp.]|nr:hypothetical protein [Roseiarcus sp.]